MNYDVSKLISIIDEKNLSAISIDGFCGSGKTYLANYLKKEIDCRIIRTDDFYPFTPQAKQRALQNSVNIDYDRFIKEISNIYGTVDYLSYSCKTGEFMRVTLPYKRLTIIEGSYSHFLDLPYEVLKVYLDCPKEIRLNRLKERPNYNDFITTWLPKEEEYQSRYDIKKNADIVLEHIDN